MIRWWCRKCMAAVHPNLGSDDLKHAKGHAKFLVGIPEDIYRDMMQRLTWELKVTNRGERWA